MILQVPGKEIAIFIAIVNYIYLIIKFGASRLSIFEKPPSIKGKKKKNSGAMRNIIDLHIIHLPANNHKLHIRAVFADAPPYIHGENSAAAVEDGGEG